MKSIILSLILLLTIHANAQEIFTAKQQNTILNEIDTFCGDTFCEGDFNYRFSEFRCEQEISLCVLDFQFWEYGQESLKEWGFCNFKNIHSLNDIYRTSTQGRTHLMDKFAEPLIECVTTFEEKFREKHW